MSEHLTRDEFLAHMGYLRGDIAGVHDRLDTLNGRTRANEQNIAVLQDREGGAGRSGAKWGAGLGAAVSALITGLLHAFGGSR